MVVNIPSQALNSSGLVASTMYFTNRKNYFNYNGSLTVVLVSQKMLFSICVKSAEKKTLCNNNPNKLTILALNVIQSY